VSAEYAQSEVRRRILATCKLVSSWEELHALLAKMSDTAWIFRGVSSPEHLPIPSIGREAIYGGYKQAQEVRLFEEFKNRAVSLVHAADFDDWSWLAYAQHIGVPTRLLDWTASPLVAVFFALQANVDTDRAIFCVKYSRYIHEVERKGRSPFDCTEGRFTPPLLFDRVRAQRGLFTIHPHPTKVFYRNTMRMIQIPNALVRTFRKRLFKYGIDHWHIYPDFEGLGQQLRWNYRERIGLGSVFTAAKDGQKQGE
jgi:FRG domain